jgi:dTDP-glucose pyrophosphorylase
MYNNAHQFWRNTLLPIGSTIQQAIRSLEVSGMQIVLVVSRGELLVGTLTDGDIRRAFLRGLSLNSKIDDIIHLNPFVVPPEIGREQVLQLMRANKIHQLPMVNSGGVVEGLHLWDSVITPESIENLMVIMAGGRGTRLHPHTENCPKPMLEVGGKPMLERIVEHAKADGFENFVISINYLGHMIEDYFGDGQKWGVRINYLREESPLGTAGSMSILSVDSNAPFVVTNGDVLTDIRYSDILDFHLRHQALATMAVRQYELQNQFGVVKVKGVEIEGFQEKPIYHSHINAGIYVLDPVVLLQLQPNQYCDMPTLFERIRQNSGLTIAYPMHEPWLDVGRSEDLIKAQTSFNGKK